MRTAFCPPFQPEMVPSSVAKMKWADVPGVPGTVWKSVGLPLKTTPVGVDVVPAGEPFGGGTVTLPVPLMRTAPPVPVERADVPELLLATHQGLPPGERVSPQGFFRLGSVGFGVEIEARFETRFVCL